MAITRPVDGSPWLLLVFTLPASKASERVQIWRKLQKIGSIPFRNAGYMLPNTNEHLERFEWLATAIRGFKGEASILQIESGDDLPVGKIKDQFREARAGDYAALLEEIGKLKPSGAGKTSQSGRWRKHFEEIALIDFFQSPLRASVEEAIAKVERGDAKTREHAPSKVSKADYQKRTWLTRPRPGSDRVSSAWLISHFIDPKAKFVFGNKPAAHPKAVPRTRTGCTDTPSTPRKTGYLIPWLWSASVPLQSLLLFERTAEQQTFHQPARRWSAVCRQIAPIEVGPVILGLCTP
jgi:hypothetical protein